MKAKLIAHVNEVVAGTLDVHIAQFASSEQPLNTR